MPSTTRSLIALATIGLLACGGDKPRTDVALDSTRPGDSLTPLVDAPRTDTGKLVAPPGAATAARPTTAPKPAPGKSTQPAPVTTTRPPAPLPAKAPSLDAGTTVATTAIDSIHSHVTKVGDRVQVRVSSGVSDADGKEVIPAGAIVTLHVTEIGEAQNRGEKGILSLSADNIEIDGTSYPISARASDYTYEMKARPIGAGEVAKTGAGVAAGAIVGRIIGGKTGTIVGAVGGGAAGAAVAAKSANRDIIVHSGASVTLKLREQFFRAP